MSFSEEELKRYNRQMMIEGWGEEALKYLSGTGAPLKGQLLVWEGGTTDFKKYRIRRDPECATCGDGRR